jgi:hypothetical protein
VVGAVSDTASLVVAPVANTVRDTTAPIADTVENATRPIAVTIADRTAAGTTTREPSAAPSGRSEAGAAPSLDGEGPSAGGTAGGGSGSPGDPTAPGEVPGAVDDPLGAIGDALAGGLQPGPGVTDAPDGPAVILPIGDPSSSEVPFAAPPGAGAGAAAAETSAQSASDPTVLDAVAATATDPQVLAATAVAFTIGLTVGGARLLYSGEGQLMFTNVRLLPCLIREGVQQHIAPLVSALPGSGAAAPAAALSTPDGAVSGAHAESPGHARRHGLSGLTESFRDGFQDALEGGNRDIGEALGDSRLMIQIGMALGFLYAAFLSVWFWATRLRGGPDRDAEGA